MLPPPLWQSPTLAPVHLARAGAALKLLGDLDHLREAGGADRMALAQQAARGADRDAAAEPGRALFDQAAAFALRGTGRWIRRP